nr:NADH dehydrogenase subunit 5 [Ceriodaphnia dubia]
MTFMSSLFLIFNSKTIFLEWMIGGSSLSLSMTLLFDYISCLFMSVVFCISSSVVWYSMSYMSSDKDANRFIYLVFGFVISMILLILSPNILSILLGWDGLGLISYCLVVYYPTKKSSSAGMVTVLSNRVGDICVLLSIAWFSLIGDFNFTVWNQIEFFSDNIWIPFLMMAAAMTKSAQIPFSAWLPAAMAAPTPVSALVHSSTLVTAGVYLLIRFSYLLEQTWSPILLFISTMTMFMSGIVAVFEFDLKKIIALSTLSQLGMMMFSISLGLYSVAFFHLITHALFKALLFLCAGILIHGIGGSQDIRIYGSLSLNYPLVGVCLNLANLSLCGIPFMSGFYSKDLIVELACQSSWNMFIILMMFISLGLTVVYSVRLAFSSFVNFVGSCSYHLSCDEDYILVSPVIFLSVVSLISGPTLSWLLIPCPNLILLPLILKMGALMMISFSVVSTLSMCNSNLNLSFLSNSFLFFLGSMWFLPNLSGQVSSFLPLKSGENFLKTFDQGWLEYLIKYSTYGYSSNFNPLFTKIQNNTLKTHFVVFIMWVFLGLMFIK